MLYHFFLTCCKAHISLVCGDYVIDSQEGFQQGDLIASVGFCMVIQPALTSMQSQLKVGYLDAISAGDNGKIVLRDFQIFQEQARQLGLNLKSTKCELTMIGSNEESILREFEEACPGITLIVAEDLCLLGAPLGLNALDLELEKKKEDLARLRKQTLTIPAQQAFFLMKNCFAIPKLMFLLRTSPAFKCRHKLAELTQMIRDTFERITNVTITDEAWGQTTLPVKLGGFRLRSPSDIASSAYISSSISCHDLISALLKHELDIVLFQEAVTDWRARVNPHKPSPLACNRQKSWTEPIAKRCQEQLIVHADDIQLARLGGCTALGSGDWLNALLSSALGFCLTNDQFRIGCALRLGAPVSSAHA